MINFNSDKIIILMFQCGAMGHMLNFLLSTSDEISANIFDISKIKFTNGNSHDYFTCWFNEEIGERFPYIKNATVDQYREFITNNSNFKFKEVLKNNDKNIILIGHYLHVNKQNHENMYDVSPNAKYIIINHTDFVYDFVCRAYYEKFYKMQSYDTDHTRRVVFEFTKDDKLRLLSHLKYMKQHRIAYHEVLM